jgi:hypothetical protein
MAEDNRPQAPLELGMQLPAQREVFYKNSICWDTEISNICLRAYPKGGGEGGGWKGLLYESKIQVKLLKCGYQIGTSEKDIRNWAIFKGTAS